MHFQVHADTLSVLIIALCPVFARTDASSPANSGFFPNGRRESFMGPRPASNLSPQSLVPPQNVPPGHTDEAREHAGDDTFTRTFSDQDVTLSPRVLMQLDPNLHPPSKPGTGSRSLASRSPAHHTGNMSVMSIHASTDVAGNFCQHPVLLPIPDQTCVQESQEK